MRARINLLAISIVALMALAAAAAGGADSQRGDWTLSKSEVAGSVHFSLIRNGAHGNFNSSSDCRSANSRDSISRPPAGTT